VAAVGVKEKSSRDVLIKGFKLNSMVIFYILFSLNVSVILTKSTNIQAIEIG